MSYPNIPPASTLPEKATATVEFGIVACALRYWTQALDFQGRATRRDILVAMVMNLSAFTILSAVSLSWKTQLERTCCVASNLAWRCHAAA